MDFLDKIICGDCLEILPQIPNKSVELAFADPPYNVGYTYGVYKDKLPLEDYKEWCFAWFDELQRIANIIFITPGILRLNLWMERDPQWVLAWIKRNGQQYAPMGFNHWQPILFWGEIKKRNHIDVIDSLIKVEKLEHPTPSSIFLVEQLINGYTNEGDTIIDPFIGSGTAAVVAKKSGRHYIGIDIDQDYVTQSEKRISATKRELILTGIF